MNRHEFRELLATMEAGWNDGDAQRVAACFAEQVRYGDPTRYRFDSRAELLPFFAPPPGGHTMRWHSVVFDESEQAGAGEYTYEGHHRYHGAVMIRVERDVVIEWREWQHVSDLDWDEFVSGGGTTA